MYVKLETLVLTSAADGISSNATGAKTMDKIMAMSRVETTAALLKVNEDIKKLKDSLIKLPLT